MTGFIRTLINIVGYVVAGVIALGYLDILFFLIPAGGDLRYLAAPKIHKENKRAFPYYWGELSREAQEKGKRRLPLAIVVYIIAWIADVVVAFFLIRDILPAVINFFSNIK